MVGFPKYEPVHSLLKSINDALTTPRDMTFNIDRLYAIEKLFFERFCPYKPGDRVRVFHLPEEPGGNNPGYVRAYKKLRSLDGPLGTVVSVDVSYHHPDKLQILVKWDDLEGDWKSFSVLEDMIEHPASLHLGHVTEPEQVVSEPMSEATELPATELPASEKPSPKQETMNLHDALLLATSAGDLGWVNSGLASYSTIVGSYHISVGAHLPTSQQKSWLFITLVGNNHVIFRERYDSLDLVGEVQKHLRQPEDVQREITWLVANTL